MKYGKGLNNEIVNAVHAGVIPKRFNREHVRGFTESKKWNVPDTYINSCLSNASSPNHSHSMKVLFESLGDGEYMLIEHVEQKVPTIPYFNLPKINYKTVRELGHKQQSGIFKPTDSKYASSIMTNVGENLPNYEDNLSDDLILSYHGRGKGRDQTLDDYDNKALSLNYRDQQAVRVFAGGDNVYRDWGFWRIIDLKTEYGLDGFVKLIFKMIPYSAVLETSVTVIDSSVLRHATSQIEIVKKQIRYAPELRKLKSSYNNTCQVNEDHVLTGRKGYKVTVHHIYPVGEGGSLVTPNHGNEIVLCPNCHSLFDDGSLYIDYSDGETIRHWSKDTDYEGRTLRLKQGHIMNKTLLKMAYKLHWDK